MIAGLDEEIKKLQEIRKALEGFTTPAVAGKVGRGRPKGSVTKSVAIKAAATKAAPVATKRKLSPEGRKRIADAMKRRWAERRKTSTKAVAVKAPAKAAK
jgi:hypothetical protein